jgi:REP element-mobilizing transposase RayT
MSQSLSKVILHAVFSTKYRAKQILPEYEDDLHAYIAGACRTYRSNAYRVGGTSDHIHIACSLPRTISVSKLLEEVKTSSSKWMKTKCPRCAGFAWQNGYGAFSVSQSQLGSLIRYIDNQKEHHRVTTYKEELIGFLDKYEIEYDERYLWD